MYLSFEPIPAAQDPFVAAFAERREQAVGKLTRQLAQRIDGAVVDTTADLVAVFESLPPEERLAIVMHPYFNHWLFRLSALYKQRGWTELAAWLPELGRFVALPGQPPRRLSTCPVIAGTRIEVDAFHPWTEEFFAYLNHTEGKETGTIAGAPVSDTDVQTLSQGFGWIRGSWPELAREIELFVRLLVPFTSSKTKDAFSNTAWQGAIFLQAGFQDPVSAVENIVHEASHVRLNLVMAVERLHEHSWDDRVPSPFRAGPRPVTGLYHGAFVFTRAAAALDRVARMSGQDACGQRIPVLLGKVDTALRTIGDHVRLTPTGRSLIDEVAAVHAELTRAYPASADIGAVRSEFSHS